MASDTTQDLDLSEVWEAMTAAGARVYLWTQGGVSDGSQLVLLGDRHAIVVSDSEGYKVIDRDDIDELTPADEYDEDEAIRAVSDLDGYFGVVGVPGSIHHQFRWFQGEDEARDWMERRWAKTLERNPVLGTIEGAVIPAEDAFDVTYRDGNRVYFHPRQAGPGFEPKAG
jgi:hypothetical protein